MGFFGMQRNPRRRAKARRRNPGGQDGMNADELAMYIVNDGDLYRQNISMVIKNLAKKIKKGTYDPQKALKLWQYSAQWGAQKYTKEFRIAGTHGSYGMFSPSDRKDAAKQLAEHYEDELREAAGTKSNPRRRSMKRRRSKAKKSRRSSTRRRTTSRRRRTVRRSPKRGTVVTFRKGGRHKVLFKRKVASAATRAKRRAAGRRLAKMWTRAERMANLRKAWAANRRRGKRKSTGRTRAGAVKRRRVARRR